MCRHLCVCVCVCEKESGRDRETEKQKIGSLCIDFDGEGIPGVLSRKGTFKLECIGIEIPMVYSQEI